MNKLNKLVIGGIAIISLLLLAVIVSARSDKVFGSTMASNIFSVNKNGLVYTHSSTVGTEMANATNGTTATSTGGSLPAGTYYFAVTSLDQNGNETAPTSEMSCSIGTELSGTSTACRVTLTPNDFAASTRLWVSSIPGYYDGYLTATSSVFVATTTGLTAGEMYSFLKGSAYNDIKLTNAFDYYATSTAGSAVIKSGAGVLNLVTINTDAAGSVILYDNTSCSGTKIATLEASIPHGTYFYNIKFKTGLCITTAATTDLTVSYY
jgi:hypothetical protein